MNQYFITFHAAGQPKFKFATIVEADTAKAATDKLKRVHGDISWSVTPWRNLITFGTIYSKAYSKT
jgi:hypothetical protein